MLSYITVPPCSDEMEQCIYGCCYRVAKQDSSVSRSIYHIILINIPCVEKTAERDHSTVLLSKEGYCI